MTTTDVKPRVSILIPNFNNGRQSSVDGSTDLIADLLQSLHDTLKDDPTPLEIIAYDDGSNDDSLDTLRNWSAKRWRDGQAFLTLIEGEHCGILSYNANQLVRASRGEFLVRLDGDTQMLTADWAEKLCEIFDNGPPRLGVVGPKQLGSNGRVHAFGDWVLHPKSYHHIGFGCERDAIKLPMEVDHVMGCFYCFKREVFDELEGFDEDYLRGQTIDFGLRARLKGWCCFAVPQIEFIHRHGLRNARQSRADKEEGLYETLDTFRRKWGFDRLAADLDVVRERYAGTPLLWNARVFALPPALAVAEDDKVESLNIQESDWTKYMQQQPFRQRIDMRAAIVGEVMRQTDLQPQRVAVVGCGSGLFPHILAKRGLPCVGLTRNPAELALAQQCTGEQAYPQQRPEFLQWKQLRRLPLEDDTCDLVLLFDQLEYYDNPVALLHECRRILKPESLLAIVTDRARTASPPPLDPSHGYTPYEMFTQINNIDGLRVVTNPAHDSPNQPIIMVAKYEPAACDDQSADRAATDCAIESAA